VPAAVTAAGTFGQATIASAPRAAASQTPALSAQQWLLLAARLDQLPEPTVLSHISSAAIGAGSNPGA
jgi:hypothetical protein